MNFPSLAAAVSLALISVLAAGVPLAAVRRDTLVSELCAHWKSLDVPDRVHADFLGKARALSPSDDVAASALTAAAVRQWPNNFLLRVRELCQSQPLLAPVVAATAAGLRPDFSHRIAKECKRAVEEAAASADSQAWAADSTGKQPVGNGKTSVAIGKQPVKEGMPSGLPGRQLGSTDRTFTGAPIEIGAAIDAAVRAAAGNGEVGGWLWGFPGVRPEFVGSPLDIIFRPMKFPSEAATTFEPTN